MKGHRKSMVVSLVLVALVLGTVPQVSSAPNEKVRVWVEYTPGKAAQVDGLLRQAGAEQHYHFAELDAFVITVPSVALLGMAHNPNVASVEEDPLRYPDADASWNMRLADSSQPQDKKQTVPWGIDAVQARDLWDADRNGKVDKDAPTGAGRTVCIIDSGLYAEHEDFEGVPIVGGLSQVDDNWARDGYWHGTHIAGTITAANNKVGVVGVSPGDVSLFIVKFFNDEGEPMYSSDLVAAIYACEANGANLISMSLGGDYKWGLERKAFDALYSRGILFVASAGNEGLELDHYPASYDSVISVAAIKENLIVPDWSNFCDQVELAAPGENVLSTAPFIETAELTVDRTTYSGIPIKNAAYGRASGPLVDGGLCNAPGDWGGMVVLCERGAVYFSDMVRNVEDSGGVAVVIYNNEPGDLYPMLLPEHYANIPGMGITQEEGQFLVANMLGSNAEVVTSYEWPVSAYLAWHGTSMAVPHVSGVAALIWSANPDWTNVQIREAMNQTALDLGDPGRDIHYGYGLVQAYDAQQYLYQAEE